MTHIFEYVPQQPPPTPWQVAGALEDRRRADFAAMACPVGLLSEDARQARIDMIAITARIRRHR